MEAVEAEAIEVHGLLQGRARRTSRRRTSSTNSTMMTSRLFRLRNVTRSGRACVESCQSAFDLLGQRGTKPLKKSWSSADYYFIRHAIPVLQRLKSYYIPQIATIQHEGRPVEPPTTLPWYPNEMGWQMSTPKQVVRKYAPFAEFKKYLVAETTVGNISRQEVVSMVPPLVLDVKPGMTVLDLCAAPGSKTAQLIEAVHGGEEARMRKVVKDFRQREGREVSPDGEEIQNEMQEEEQQGDWSDDGRSTGLVLANDSDYRRAHLLIHQAKRLNSPNLVVTNHDASIFPSIKLPPETAPDGKVLKNKYLKFDRILADVPCSGDGTARKNLNVWKDWAPLNGIGLHSMQLRILVRALQMLKAGGKIVYSTCSMNPVENEAVVGAAIETCGGSSKVEILDSSEMLPGLKRRHGLQTWKVMDRSGRIWDRWEAVLKQKEEHGADGLGKLAHTMFPMASNAETLPLERCMRVYPHLQDTGAFFIAVLQKKSEIKATPYAEQKDTSAKEASRTIQAEADLSKKDAVDYQPGAIMAIINEIEAQKPDKSDPSPYVAAADGLVPPPAEPANRDRSATQRQNEAIAPTPPVPGEKRARDEEMGAYQAAKRVRTYNENGDRTQPGDLPTEPGDEDRMVHWPPPPAAQIEEKDVAGPQMNSNGVPKKKEQQFEEPFKYLDPQHSELQGIYKFYGLQDRFPRDRFMVRNAQGTATKTIYYTSTLARNILQENEGSGIKFVHCGIKAFVRQDVPREDVCRWRIQTDGLPLLEPWVSEDRIIRLHSKKTLHKLLLEMFPKVSGDDWKGLGEIGERLREAGLGCHVLRVEKGDGEDSFRHAHSESQTTFRELTVRQRTHGSPPMA